MSFNGAHRFMSDFWKEQPVWEEWYAWHPVKDIHGERHWLKKIYRRYNWAKSTEQPFGKEYDYGTIFDVLSQEQEKDGHFATIKPVVGTMLFDHNTYQYKVYTGAGWVHVTDAAAQSYVNTTNSQVTSTSTK